MLKYSKDKFLVPGLRHFHSIKVKRGEIVSLLDPNGSPLFIIFSRRGHVLHGAESPAQAPIGATHAHFYDVGWREWRRLVTKEGR